MMHSRIAVSMLSVLAAGMACAQTATDKPVRFVTTGGSGEVIVRMISTPLSANLRQPVVVDPRSDAVARDSVGKAAPDGLTMLISGIGMWSEHLVMKQPYDPLRDFSPIMIVTTSPYVLIVPQSFPAKSLKELLALAKAKPGTLNFPSAGLGLHGELFKATAGIDVVNIRYKTVAQAITSLLAGETQFMLATVEAATPQVRAGKMRALGLASLRPSALAPGMPTIDSEGLAGFEYTAMQNLFAPGKTPAATVNRLNQELKRVLLDPDMKDRLFKAGLEVMASSPQDLINKMESDIPVFRKLIQDAGIKAE